MLGRSEPTSRVRKAALSDSFSAPVQGTAESNGGPLKLGTEGASLSNPWKSLSWEPDRGGRETLGEGGLLRFTAPLPPLLPLLTFVRGDRLMLLNCGKKLQRRSRPQLPLLGDLFKVNRLSLSKGGGPGLANVTRLRQCTQSVRRETAAQTHKVLVSSPLWGGPQRTEVLSAEDDIG